MGIYFKYSSNKDYTSEINYDFEANQRMIEKISRTQIKTSLARMKKIRIFRINGIPNEVWVLMGEMGLTGYPKKI